MKTALFLSGQPRFVEECYPFIFENLIKPNDADVFIHHWNPVEGYNYKYSSKEYDPNWKDFTITSDVQSKIKAFYGPKECVGEDPIDFYLEVPLANSIEKYYWGVKNLSPAELEKWKKTHIRNSLSMWNSIYKAFNLIPKDTYDCIIRCRFDVQPLNPIKVSELDLNKISYINMDHPSELISDWLGIGSYEVMDTYTCIYEHWQNLVQISNRKHNAWCNESLLGDIFQLYNMERNPQRWQVKLCRM